MDDDRHGGLREEQLIGLEEMNTLIKESIEQTIGQTAFLHIKLDTWTQNVVEGCLKRLAALQKPFKFVVMCNLLQKVGAGLHMASATTADSVTDGVLCVKWENPTIQAIVTVYWCAI